ncbi:MAG: hypothetical protein QOI11_1970 [Candidatus Eremiobacteraeota bacterium]|jgi:hypothetical protein|nr:hypothetical protein [Candidatus Eremiobacteraeota bacterium]
MTSAKRVPDEGVTLTHAAAVLRRKPKVIDGLVRREKIVPAYGKPGRGGEYRLDRESLVTLDTAARLEELHVPKAAIKRLVERLREQLDSEGEIALVYSPEKEDVVPLGTGAVNLRDLIAGGVTVEVVTPKEQRAEFERRLALEEAPRRRGRPKLDAAWTSEKLDRAAALGDDDTPSEDMSHLIGERGTPPWRRGR